MSISSFHRAFRQVTLVSPLQYMKQIRLNRARELIQREGRGIAEAASLVGYNSPSQFSREYKRHFCVSPKRDVEVGGGRGGLPRVYAFADALPRGSASLETSIPSNARSLVFASSPPA